MILVSSYPKSGATWFQFLMYACFHGEIQRSYDVRQWYPEDFEKKRIQEKLRIEEPFFVKTHVSWYSFLPWQDHISACICLYRNPLDVCVSKFNHYKYEGVGWVYEEKGLRKFVEEFVGESQLKPFEKNERHHKGGWNSHMVAWAQGKKAMKVAFVSYEALLQDVFAEVSRLNEELTLGLSDSAIRRGCELASFESLKKLEEKELLNETGGMFYSPKRKKAFLENGVRFINQGKAGTYQETLNQKEIQAITETCQEGMRLGGYLD